jgi:GT2 family glycosyltransferase
MPLLGLAMIVKDEEEVLARCLESAKGLVDEIVIVDTGSTDRTVEIARGFGARVLHHTCELLDGKWIPDFSAARNQSFEAVESEWIFWLDADDIIAEGDLPAFLELKASLTRAAYDCVQLPYYYTHRPDGQPEHIVKDLPRILRRSIQPRWADPVHECLHIPPPERCEKLDLPIHHYKTGKGMAACSDRNLRIMKAAIDRGTASDRIRFYYGKELFDLRKYDECEPYLLQHIDRYGVVDLQYSMEAAWRLMFVYEDTEKPEKSEAMAYRAIQMDWRWPHSYMALARVAMGRGDRAAEEHWARIAYELPPPPNEVFSPARIHGPLRQSLYMLALFHSGKTAEAREINEEMLRDHPGEAELIKNMDRFALPMGTRRHPRDHPIRLYLGSGGRREEGWWSCDVRAERGVDEVFSLDVIPYESRSVDAIRLDGGLECLPGREARHSIGEWARVLRPGGTALLRVVDFEGCIRAYLESEAPEKREQLHHAIFGHQGGTQGQARVHRTGFSAGELETLFQRHGFVVQCVRPYADRGTPSLELSAVKERSQIRTVWICSSNREAVQTRLRCLEVSDAAVRMGYHSEVIPSFKDLHGKRLTVGIVSNGQILGTAPIVRQLREAGAKLVADLCEDLLSLEPALAGDLKEYDRVVCSSHVLAEKVRAAGANAMVIEDSVEAPAELSCEYDPPPSTRLRVGWMGYGGGVGLAEALRPVVAGLGMDLVTIHEHPGATYKWSLETWAKDLASCHIAICPADPLRAAKGQVKAAQAMGLGLPVVVGPQDSYTRIVRHGVNGLVARTPAEWEQALRSLQDPRLRQQFGRAGRLTAENFRLPVTARKWWDLVEELGNEAPEEMTCEEEDEKGHTPAPASPQTGGPDLAARDDAPTAPLREAPPVTTPVNPPAPSPVNQAAVALLVTTYNCLDYTKVCVDSLRQCRGEVPYEIHIIDAGSDDGTQDWVRSQSDLTLHGGDRRRTFAEVVNLGIAETGGPFFCVLNNDIVVSPGWLDEMVHVARTRERCAAVGVLSNCDVGWLYHKGDQARGIAPVDPHIVDGMVVQGKQLGPKIRLGEVDIPAVIEHGRESNARYKGQVRERPWVALYCTLIARSTLGEVGVLDEEFKTGGEDVDFCYRLQRADYNIQTALGAFVFHWGAVSRQDDQVRRGEDYNEEDRFNNWYLGEKWKKPNAVIFTGQAWERWSPKSIDEGGLGGSETCEALLARELVRKGWRVVFFGDCADREGDYDGVQYLDWRKFERHVLMNYFDLFISSRRVDTLDLPIRAGATIVHVHDVWLSQDKNLDLRPHKVGAYGVLSPWHREFIQSHHQGIPKDKLWVIPDGVDGGKFEGWEHVQKNPYRAHYVSSWDRGLWNLLSMWPRIRAEVPQAELHVYYGCYNWEEAIKLRNDDHGRQHLGAIKELMQQPGVINRGRLGQHALAQEIQKDNVALRPQWFDETFGMSAVESMLGGAIVVGHGRGGLMTTVGENGILFPEYPGYFPELGEPFAARFVPAVVDVMKNPAKYDDLRRRARAHAEQFDWSKVADLWIQKTRELVSRKSSSIGASRVPLPTF